MQIEEIVTNEFLEYKRGFMDGRDRIISDISTGNISSIILNNYSWYSIGYIYAVNFYYEYYETSYFISPEILMEFDPSTIVKDNFIETIRYYNYLFGKSVPAMKLKVKM